jgi:hypothetical protein
LRQIPHNACGINGFGRLKFQRKSPAVRDGRAIHPTV